MIDYTKHAYEYFDAGVCPVPVRTDGSKRPNVKSWTGWQNERYERDEIETLFAGAGAIGTICGKASGNLEMLEFEAKAIDEGVYVEFLNRVRQAGMMSIFRLVAEGYTVKSPSGGMHVEFRVDGDALGNTKLARRMATPEELAENPDDKVKVLIETRGQGGFVVSPPSNGSTHPSGEAWVQVCGGAADIATITVDQRDALYAIARSLDRMPVAVGELVVRGLPLAAISAPHRDDQSPLDWARENIDPQQLMIEGGWTLVSTRGDEQQWTRPGKDPRKGTSATLHLPHGPLNIYSPAVDPAYERAGGRKTKAEISLSVGGLLAAVRFDGHLSEASSWVRSIMPRPLGVAPRAPALTDASDVPERTPTAGLNLPPEFWLMRPWLTQVRDAAWSRLISPDAVLGALLSRVSVVIPPSYLIPPIVGSAGSFDHLSILAGHSSGGKTSAANVARELFPDVYENAVEWDVENPSGEGLIDSLFDEVDELDDAGKVRKVYKQVKTGVHFGSDEAMSIVAQSRRQGTTIISVILSAWSGSGIGQSNTKSGGRRRRLRPRTYRISGLMGIQMELGHELLGDALVQQGFAGRVVFFSAEDPAMPHPDDAPAFPGPLGIDLPPIYGAQTVIEYPDELARQIRIERWEGQTGQTHAAPIDGHLNLVRLKIAGIIAIIENRRTVTLSDWTLAQTIVTSHIALRTTMLSYRSEAVRRAAVTRGTLQGEADEAAQDVRERKAIARMSDRIVATATKEGIAQSKLRKAVSGSRTKHLYEAALAQAVDRGSVEIVEIDGGHAVRLS